MSDAANPKAHFFLDEVDADDLFFRGPSRSSCLVEPLIDRSSAFQAMERAVMQAESTVVLAGWIFFARTPLLDADVRRTTRGQTWADLLGWVLRKRAPVEVRIIVTDFDPFFAAGNHRACWSALSDLVRLQSRLPAGRDANLQCIASLHDFFITPFIVFSMKDRIAATVKEYGRMPFVRANELYRRTPGHWSSIQVDTAKKRFSIRTSPESRIFLASHHQKFCVVDGRVAFCGGMDLTPLALDTHTHKPRRHPFKRGQPDLSWHDIHARIEGSVVADIERGFRTRWNQEMFGFIARISALAAVAPASTALPFTKLTAAADAGLRAALRPGTDAVQALRTMSVNKAGQVLPDVKRQDVLEAYAAAIGAATSYVYLENQYFRAPEITDLLIARHGKIPKLQVIVVIPIAPEELTDLKSIDPMVSHPIAVQIKQIERLQAALGANFGVFSLVLRARAKTRKFTDAHGSPQLYVHSKIAIVDDTFATIGSANVNGRSFAMDTELNVAWVHKTRVQAFRIKLWEHLLGTHAAGMRTWDPASFATRWRAAAALNARQSPEARGGFVVPHDNALLKSVAKELLLVPDTFINIHDMLPESLPPDLIEMDEARDVTAAAVA